MSNQKRRWPWLVGGVLAICAIAAGTVYFFFPQVLLTMVRARYERASGVTAKQVEIDGYSFPYYEGGKGDPLVLIHGFGDRKMSFLQLAQWLTPHYRVILPEVQGFGDTKRDPKRKYSIHKQVERFHKFFQKLGLKQMYLGGNSMGGHISAAYTLAHPKQVRKLLLLNAAGLKAPNAPLPYKHSKSGIETRKDFYDYMKKVFYKTPMIPKPIEAYLIAQMRKNHAWNNHIARDIREGKEHLLNDRVAQITVPTLVLWGDSDRIVNEAIGRLYHAQIKGSKWIMMTKCGHSPQYERPQETAEHLLKFLRTP